MPSLYQLLGVPREADDSTIRRAYRRTALQYHPDRNPDGGDHFRVLTQAYEILCDESRRATYDMTGVVPEEASALDGMEDEARKAQEEAAFRAQLDQFYETYTGTEEERADLAKSIVKAGGDLFVALTEHALFRNTGPEAVTRVAQLMKEIVAGNPTLEIDATLFRRTSTAKAVKRAVAWFDEERTEAATEDKAAPDDMGSLQQLILARNKEKVAAWDTFCDGLGDKYGGKKGGAGKKKQGKKPRAA